MAKHEITGPAKPEVGMLDSMYRESKALKTNISGVLLTEGQTPSTKDAPCIQILKMMANELQDAVDPKVRANLLKEMAGVVRDVQKHETDIMKMCVGATLEIRKQELMRQEASEISTDELLDRVATADFTVS